MLSPRRAHHAVARSVVASGLLAIVGAGAHAEPSIATSADVAVGGGSYAGAWYAGADLRLDTQWRALQVGLGARFDAVDGNWHSLDFHQRRDALRVLRYAQWQHRWGDNSVALAAGNLAPLTLGTLAHGYRASIDVRRRVGVTARVVASSTEVEGFVDDVLQPYVAASAVSMAVRRGWRARVAAVADVDVGQGAIELSGRRVGTVEKLRLEGGAGLVVEPGIGTSAVLFGQAEMRVDRLRIIASADVRAGSGTVGAAFGPLYRLERSDARMGQGLWQLADGDVLSGIGGGATLTLARPDLGWVAASLQRRPGLGTLATATAGAPMGPRWQAGAWLAASESALAGAAEIRWLWSARWWTAAEVARAYGLADSAAAMDVMSTSRPGTYGALWAGARM